MVDFEKIRRKAVGMLSNFKQIHQNIWIQTPLRKFMLVSYWQPIGLIEPTDLKCPREINWQKKHHKIFTWKK